MAKRLASKKVESLEPIYEKDGFKLTVSKEFTYEKMTFSRNKRSFNLIDSKTVTSKEDIKRLSVWEKQKDGSSTANVHVLLSAPLEWLQKNKYVLQDA